MTGLVGKPDDDGEKGGSRRIVAYVPDLMDRSRISAVCPDTAFVRSLSDLVVDASSVDLVVVDLSRPGVLDAVGGLPSTVESVGFVSHVDREAIATAKAAGVGSVISRSKFFSQLVTILG